MPLHANGYPAPPACGRATSGDPRPAGTDPDETQLVSRDPLVLLARGRTLAERWTATKSTTGRRLLRLKRVTRTRPHVLATPEFGDT